MKFESISITKNRPLSDGGYLKASALGLLIAMLILINFYQWQNSLMTNEAGSIQMNGQNIEPMNRGFYIEILDELF